MGGVSFCEVGVIDDFEGLEGEFLRRHVLCVGNFRLEIIGLVRAELGR